MDTVRRENAVKYFAKDAYHYACAKDWTSMIRTVIKNVEGHVGKLAFLPQCWSLLPQVVAPWEIEFDLVLGKTGHVTEKTTLPQCMHSITV